MSSTLQSVSKDERSVLDRRTVALGAIAGVPCLAIGLRAAVAEAAASGKPVLTEGSFNALVRRRSQQDHGRGVAAEMGHDFRGFIRSNFTLTPVQERRLDAIPPSAMSQLEAAFSHAASEGGAITISFVEPKPGAPSKSGKVSTMAASHQGKQVTLHVASSTVTWSTE